ncbi:MAG: 4Fe-4S dicluster domain-containing protein, partial [Spirochaetia bacterium]|nr:4Fe-4S dicluster domain-containing protein [Spirochaetia bacterium]
MNTLQIHHTLTVISQQCKGCTHCMKRCPTGAIRIHGGKANIDAKLCIDCGQCMAVCSNKAIKVEQDSLTQLTQYTYTAAVIPASFFVQFAEHIPLTNILWALYEIGFTHLYLAETGVDILSELPIEDRQTKLPVISNFCPAVQRLIQIKFPLLVGNLSIIRPPAQITAIFVKLELHDIEDQLGIFYVTPCAAKLSQFKTEGSEEHTLFAGIINFDTLYNRVCTLLAKNTEQHPGYAFSFNSYTQKALLWS